MASEAHLIPVDLERMPRADFQRDAAADVDDVIGRDDLVALCMGGIVWSASRQVRRTCVCVCVCVCRGLTWCPRRASSPLCCWV